MPTNQRNSNKQLLLQYAGLGFQLMAAIAAAILLGRWIDGRTQIKFPAFTFALPALVIIAMLIRVVRDTKPPGPRRGEKTSS